MIRRPPRSPLDRSSAASDVYKRQGQHEHHYHHDDYQAGTATQATRQATSQGLVVGAPIRAWDPGLLGVHASITVHDETTLTPYLARDHDQQLRQVLEHAAASEQPSLVLVVGTSCSGKTRTLYEAVTAVLPDWAVIAPRSDSRLAQALLDGIPARTVIWLGEPQDRPTDTPPRTPAPGVRRKPSWAEY